MKKIHRMRSLMLPVTAVIGLAFTGVASAQQVKVKAQKPSFEALPSPVIDSGGVNKKFKPKDWLEMEVEFEVDAKSKKQEPKSGFYDRITVKWYVAVEDPESKGKKYILLEKEIVHVNVPVGEKIYSSVYLSPSSVRRLTGGDRAGKSVVKYVGGEITYQGEAVARFSNERTKGWPKKVWWNSGELSRSAKIPLRNKNETPFKFLWHDRYAEIQERKF